MVGGVILASGMSERFGQNKLLMPLGHQSIVENVIDQAIESKLKGVYLVYGHHEREFEEIARKKGISLIYNPDYALGQSKSVKKAVENIEGDVQGLMFLLGDQPFIGKKTINLLIDTFSHYPQDIVLPTFNGNRGNPVIFSQSFFEEMKTLQGDKGAREIIKKYPHRIVKVPIAEEMENYDIDTQEDYQKAIEYRRDQDGSL
ncbi:molybdenum cofactor cytidylyltransferase [Irregularibacter muris]|jgi:molybdenum cofactor cytidylyltransferase|uniref:Molybdenum cofactor cytidylyltransferase n=1 Tax=Irregularibacter muris TaxID=1796619 RepID=A0AAE3HHY9_9FIRM|nr:molybdenum cofactor cytidylyltransferase [Irregularibacter muris]MCR1899284.1 molybdenum cofactor cytidylyltransferase [Irregularibacter muris]